MNIWGYHYKNIRPLSGKYTDDPDLSLKSTKVATSEGLDLYFSEALSGTMDVTYNNYNQMWLTEKKDGSQCFEQKTSITQYPKYRTSYMKVSGTEAADARYLVVNGSTGTCEVTGTAADLDNRYYFEFEFINATDCYIRHTRDNVLKYLTVTQSNSSALTFTTRVSGEYKLDSQMFEYKFDETTGELTLFRNLSAPVDASIPLVVENNFNMGGDLTVVPLPTTTTFQTSGNIFYLIPKPVTTPTSYNVDSAWTRYSSSVDKNTNSVDVTNTLTNIKNNYILYSSTNNLDYTNYTLKSRIFPLKTLLTPAGEGSKNNPYAGKEPANDHRSYGKLYTGANQENGYESIYTSYESGIKELLFDTDKLTYFRAPQRISPYSRANLNDLSLYKSGAIAGNTPIKSDKIFKDLRASRNNSTTALVPENSELRGTWLCSWLSGNSNSSMSPVWVDRYYNPSFHTRSVALSAGVLTPVVYVDNYTFTTNILGASAQHITMYDKLSDLTIEPGVLYAYHHIGSGNSRKIINSLRGDLIIKDLREYKSITNVQKDVKYDYTGPTHVMSDGSLHTGYKHEASSVEVPKLYTFNVDSYGVTDCLQSHCATEGSFTLTFWLNCTDWSVPFGNQIIGNYMTHGFGFYNKDYIAPMIMIPSDTDIVVYNSNFDYIDSYDLQRTITKFVKKGNLENFWIIDSDNNICEYTVNGIIQNIITSSHLTDETVSDIDVNGTVLYILIEPDPENSANATYVEYDMSNTTSSYDGTLKTVGIWNYGKGVSDDWAASIHAVSNGLSAVAGAVITIQDAMSARIPDTHEDYSDEVRGSVALGSTSMVDNSGSPWTVQHNRVYTYDTTTTSNISALSSDHIIEGIACDTSNNIWALHSNIKLTKLDNNRKHLFTLSLTGLSSVSTDTSAYVVYNRYIDFISEFDSAGNHVENCLTINQSVSGCKFIKISLDGSTTTLFNVVSGKTVAAAPVTFFKTPTKSWKTITGHNYLRKHARDDNQQVKARLKLSRPYNSSTTTETFDDYTLTYNVSSIKPGWNHFAISLNAEKGKYEMYINTVLVDSTAVPQGAYSRSIIFDNAMTVGATPFYTKSYLFEHLNQTGHHLCNNISLKGIYLYNTALDYYDIKAHYDVGNLVMPLRWTIPTGQRSYLDTIERTFNFRVPGRKSELFDINIYNTLVTDYRMKADLQSIISGGLVDAVPAYSKLNTIKWDGVSLSAAASGQSLNIVTNVNQPSEFVDDIYIVGGETYYG